MAHLLANNPGQPDAGEILLSGFTHMALQMEAQRRLMKPGSKPRRGKKGPKKQPQRGLGVAQLEKIRLEEQRRVSQHTQQLVALRQLQTAPPLFSPNAGMLAPASIIPQLERESNNHASSLMLHTHPPIMSSSLSHFPCIDTMASSFLVNNVSPALSSTVRSSAHATPLDLFPTEKLGATTTTMTSSIKVSYGMLPEKSWSLRHVENKDCVENHQSLLNLPYDQSNEGHDHGSMSYSLHHMRRNCVPIAELRSSVPILTQVPNRMVSMPSFSRDRMVELSSFQSAAASSRGEELVFPKRRAWGAGAEQRPGSGVHCELPIWAAIPSLANSSKSSQEHEIYCRSQEECELTLRPPGADNSKSVKEERPNEAPACGRGPHNFLSLSVGAMWEESVADASSSTPSPVSATTKTTTTSTTSTTDEYTSPLSTNMPCATNFFSTKGYLSKESQSSLCDINVDLTLKL